MKSTTKIPAIVMAVSALISVPSSGQGASDGWKSHDMSRPKPPRVTPSDQQLPVPAPEGAVILFDGTDLSAWSSDSGSSDAEWTVVDDYFEVKPGAGAIESRAKFGDVQLHVEWASPDPPRGSGQDRGNSGVFLMNRYEIQVLDSYDSDTYADGQAAAVYGQYPPRFNATRAPGEWQSYDIYFRRPRFEDGRLREPARVTVVHNGVLVQDNVEFLGPTSWLKHLEYEPHADAEPIQLQDHGHPVRFRNIWALPLPDRPLPPAGYMGDASADAPPPEVLEAIAGVYDRPGQNAPITITMDDGRLAADFFWRPGALDLLPESEDVLRLKDTDGWIEVQRNAKGKPSEIVFHLGGAGMKATRR